MGEEKENNLFIERHQAQTSKAEELFILNS